MRLPVRSLVRAAVASLAIFAAVAVAWAETCTLEIKRLDSPASANSSYIQRAVRPQNIFIQMGKDGAPMGNQAPMAAFKRIVTKEPKYASEKPFRSVVKFGSQEFAFVLDAVPPPEDKKTDGEKSKDEKPKDEKDKEKPKADSPPAKATGFNRLYFDLNGNGDLTDDKVIEAKAKGGGPRMLGGKQSYSFFQFPRVDVTINDEGNKLDYSFLLQGQSVSSPDFSYVSMSLTAAAYREGDITLDGKKHHVALVDLNSNGRFGDETKINKNIHAPNGQIYPEQGDVLLVDPTVSNVGSPYDMTSGDSRHYVSKLINIDGRFYDMKISPAGDKLTLEPTSTALGNITNPNGAFRAVIYGDLGFLKIHADKDAAIPVPEGEWKLLAYTLDRTGAPNAATPEKKKADEKKAEEKKGSMLESLAKDLGSLVGNDAPAGRQTGPSIVTAQGTDAYKAVKVVKGETVVMPFGPPYKPTVTGQYFEDGNKHQVLSLGMSLVGSAGEICSNMIVNGGRPAKPKFTITDGKGKVVQEGNFEYG